MISFSTSKLREKKSFGPFSTAQTPWKKNSEKNNELLICIRRFSVKQIYNLFLKRGRRNVTMQRR